MKITGTMPGGQYGCSLPITIEVTKQIWMAYALPILMQAYIGYNTKDAAAWSVEKSNALWEVIEKQQ